MRDKILVAYASLFGSTHEIAEVIGQALRDTGVGVDVRPIPEVTDLSDYRAVVVGSAVRVGQWLPQAAQFIAAHRDVLSQAPTAYFTVCVTMKEDTPENRQTVLEFMKPVLEATPEIKPLSIGLFGGAIDYDQFGPWMRVLVASRHLPQGDFRNWNAIRSWAQEIGPLLVKSTEAV